MILDEIVANKKNELKSLKLPRTSRRRALLKPMDYLRKQPFIAEIKRASPSEGAINMDLDYIHQAQLYKQHGAGMLSVLTDRDYFNGSFQILDEIAQQVELPVLCKDFIITKQQIDMAYLCGADSVLLIISILEPDSAYQLYSYACSLGLCPLVEIYEIEERFLAQDLRPSLLGVNNRNLKNMQINLSAGLEKLRSIEVPAGSLRVVESGINSREDVQYFRPIGDVFLVGSYLMRSSNIEQSFKNLYAGWKT